MSQRILFVAPLKNRTRDHLSETAGEHAAAISSALEVLQLLHDRGVLDLLRGVLAAGDRVVETMTAAVDTPEAVRSIRNFILLTKLFGSIPPDLLGRLVQIVIEGVDREKSHQAPGLWALLRSIRSANSQHALAVALDLLEAIGKGL